MYDFRLYWSWVGTYGAVVSDDTVRDVTVGADAGVAANQNVLHHLTAVAQADP